MRLLRSLAIISTLAISCVGTEVGNPQAPKKTEVTVEFTGYERQDSAALVLENGVEITEAWFVFDRFRLRQAADCEGQPASEHKRTFAVELISGRELAGLGASTHPATSYCRMELELAAAGLEDLPAEAPRQLEGLSVLVRGKRVDGTAFVLRDGLEQTLRLEGPFTLDPGREPMLVAFALNDWLSPEQLDEASGDAQIVIDSDNNSEILDSFRDAMPQSVGLFRDSNEDGDLQDEELDAQLSGASVDTAHDHETDADLDAGDADEPEEEVDSDDAGDADEEDGL